MNVKNTLLAAGGTIFALAVVVKCGSDYITKQNQKENQIRTSYHLSEDEFQKIKDNYGSKIPEVKRDWEYYKDSLENIKIVKQTVQNKQRQLDSINIMETLKKVLKNSPKELQDSITNAVAKALKNSH